MARLNQYPIGVQSFEEIRRGGYIYVDKTAQMWNLANSGKFVFLSRPRRFGKSLLASTLHAYFNGQKDLFSGLAVAELEKEWKEYPVFHFDLSASVVNAEQLAKRLDTILNRMENQWNIPSDNTLLLGDRLENLIRKAHADTGNGAVVIIDEYDKPILEVLDDEDKLKDVRDVMQNLYSVFKPNSSIIRFLFITGITKFSQLSIFSAFNGIDEYSMNSLWADVVGITHKELRAQLKDEVSLLAQRNGISFDETLQELAMRYDGYRFSKSPVSVFNPYSLIKAFKNGEMENFWFSSGTPTFLLKQMRHFNVQPIDIQSKEVPDTAFDVPTESIQSITPLLYQSGYLTIKGYDPESGNYLLDIPNREVRMGLMDSILPFVVESDGLDEVRSLVGKMRVALAKDDISSLIDLLRMFLGTVPYTNDTNTEGHYQSALYLIFSLLCRDLDVEVHTPQGRVDLVAETSRTIYIMEVKFKSSAKAALDQINRTHYEERFALKGKAIVKVGINFSEVTRNIDDWKLERY